MHRCSTFLLAVALLMICSATGQGRVAHADSEIFAIDTITAIAAEPSPPRATRFASIHPNPFNPRTSIVFELAAAGPVELAVFDLRGRLVVILVAEPLQQGQHHVTWDGLDRDGRSLASGTYVCRLVTTRGVASRKLTLTR